MPKTHEEIMKERRQYIIDTLRWFDLELKPEHMEQLDEDKNILVSTYLDPYLIPCFSIPHEKFPQRSALFPLYFKGDLSEKAWDKISSCFGGLQIAFCLTSYYEPGQFFSPEYTRGNILGDAASIQIAVHAGNIETMKRLNDIYGKEPEFYYKLIYKPLNDALAYCSVESDNGKQCFYLGLQLWNQVYSYLTDNSIPMHGFSEDKIAEFNKRMRAKQQKVEKLFSTIQPIDRILEDFRSKIPNRNCPAQDLFERLHTARNNHLQAMSQGADPDASGQQFLKTCKEEIEKARPILEKELGWSDVLVNLIKELANAVISIVSLGTTNSFFARKRSDSIVEAEKVAKDLSDALDSNQIPSDETTETVARISAA